MLLPELLQLVLRGVYSIDNGIKERESLRF